MKFTVPEFEDKELWELLIPETRGLFYHKKEGSEGELHLAVIIGGAGKNDGMLIGMMERYRYKHSDPKKIGGYGKMMKIFGVRIERWWGLEDEELPSKPFPMRVVWSGKQWEFCKPDIVKVIFDVECKDKGASTYAHLVRVRVTENNHPIFSVIIERDGKNQEGKVRLRN